ncbi:UvrD-like helicase, ATP-binding domain, P-loop containing nucleoside triphosphate hydrolase [Tanacetum coccineum]
MVYDVSVIPWKNPFSERGKDAYQTLPGDLLVLLDGKPESIFDLRRVGKTWALSLVKSNEDDSTSLTIKVKASKPIEFQDGMFAVFVMNTTTQKRIWNSLHIHRNLNIIKEVLYSYSMVKRSCNIYVPHDPCMCSNECGNYIVSLTCAKERLNVSTNIEEIFLEHRVKRLVECLGPVTGWKHCIRSMIHLLENCDSEYHSSCATPLRRCIVTFCTHIPKSFIGEYNFKNMISLLDNLSSLLFHKNVVSEESQDLFTSEPMQDDMSTISFVRAVSLSVLTTLQQSLDELTLPSFSNKYAITQFCFERAFIIFCTTSSSYKLYAVNMEPFDILVIDEAAQLKEAESIIPFQLPGLKHAILIGDEHQLPAVVNSNISLLLTSIPSDYCLHFSL